MSKIDALSILQPHLEPLREIVYRGWDDYMRQYEPEVRVVHSSTTRASIVHDHQIDRASRYAIMHREVRLLDIAKLKIILFGDRIAVRIKKLDGSLRPRNNMTDQVRKFCGQQQLQGLPTTCNLEVGYILNRAETDVQEICVVCPSGPYNNLWTVSLLQDTIKQPTKVLNLFDVQTHPNEHEEQIVIRSKRDSVVVPIRRENDES